MAKKNYAPKGAPQPEENPFAALSQLSNLPPPPENTVQDEQAGGVAGAVQDDPLRITVDRKYRRGKSATLVTGFMGSDEALQDLGKQLKVQCGVGGSVKDGVIIVQGDQRARVVELLLDLGYRNTKPAGG